MDHTISHSHSESNPTNNSDNNSPSWLRRCYLWTLKWSEHPQARTALFFIALIEASIFPIPPDILLIILALGTPAISFRLAGICTLGSTVGAVIGYCIGMFLFVTIAQPILELYHAMEKFAYVQTLFQDYGIWVVAIAGFSPIPFKVITIAAGAFDLAFLPFILTAFLSRGARFYVVAALMYWGGDYVRDFVEHHFELITLIVTILVLIGFTALWLFK
ncbi:MAG: YqaA family protein [Mariprofundales bacterium]